MISNYLFPKIVIHTVSCWHPFLSSPWWTNILPPLLPSTMKTLFQLSRTTLLACVGFVSWKWKILSFARLLFQLPKTPSVEHSKMKVSLTDRGAYLWEQEVHIFWSQRCISLRARGAHLLKPELSMSILVTQILPTLLSNIYLVWKKCLLICWIFFSVWKDSKNDLYCLWKVPMYYFWLEPKKLLTMLLLVMARIFEWDIVMRNWYG